MSEIQIAVLAALIGAVIGVVGGFLAARHIDRVGARRIAYTRYIGAVEVAGWSLRKRLIHLRDRPDALPRPAMPDASLVNTPLGEMWSVAPQSMMATVERMQDNLKEMEVAGAIVGFKSGDEITALLKTHDDLREELVNLARRQTGEGALPSKTFRAY